MIVLAEFAQVRGAWQIRLRIKILQSRIRTERASCSLYSQIGLQRLEDDTKK